jgi:hypothetical protein
MGRLPNHDAVNKPVAALLCDSFGIISLIADSVQDWTPRAGEGRVELDSRYKIAICEALEIREAIAPDDLRQGWATVR